MGKQLQVDLVDMSAYEEDNRGYRWILTGIDVFSRYLFAVPIRRKHKDFTLVAMKELLNEYEEHFGKLPDVIQSDDGGEFKNTKVIPFLTEKGIHHFSTRLTSHKASIVERANRTLKTRMWKFFNHEGKKEWIYILDDLVENVNTSTNSSIGMAPSQVTKDNSSFVFAKLYGYPHTFGKPKFEVGEKVLVSKYSSPLVKPGKKTFKKGYKASFGKEVYTIEKIQWGDPFLYHLEGVKGGFYTEELQKAP